MKVQVEDHLAAFFANIELEAVACALVLFGELFAHKNQMRHEVSIFFLEVFDAGNGLAGNHQKMDGSLWVKILYGDAPFIFKYKIGGQFFIDDFLKKSFFHGGVQKEN
jgi:hypothetical protein